MHRTLIGSIAMLATLAASASTGAATPDLTPAERLALVPDKIILGFDETDAAARWVTMNDNVMGGRSRGGFAVENGRLIFSGSTNTSGGGFSSVQTRPAPLGLEGSDALLLRVRGDGREYIASIATGRRVSGIQIYHWARFQTTADNTFHTVRIPFNRFIPTAYGEDISGMVAALDPAEARSIGLFIYDKKDGPFSLEVEWIGAAAAIPTPLADSARPGDPSSDDRMTDLPPDLRAREVIAAAIRLGVPRFNAGEHGACADIYEIAITSLIYRPGSLPGAALASLRRGLDAGLDAPTDADRAWAYRRALDAAHAALVPPPRMNAMAD